MDAVDGFLVIMLQIYLQVCFYTCCRSYLFDGKLVNLLKSKFINKLIGPEPTGQSTLATSDSVSDRESVRVYHNLVCQIFYPLLFNYMHAHAMKRRSMQNFLLHRILFFIHASIIRIST